ncbi:MAG: acyl-CoA dehydrogenase [Streptomycetaceae bacterium]|nr:acyl-CoA dehydrogenase [Streptomycetaceae bacterium]
MDLRYTEAEERFRGELRAWLDEALPKLPAKPDRNDWPARRAYDTTWQRMLFEAGYAGIHWSVEAGGKGATPTEHLIYLEETERAGAPYVGANFVGLLHAGPTIDAAGTEEQRRKYLPGILSGDDVWCQGFSEPGAGSDLASLRTRAVRDGDEYVINGSKIWTSHAEVADYCEMLVRTDPDAPKHKGITWLIVPMDTPGITIRPLETVMGTSEFAEVFFDDVRVPVANRVGEENDGWRVTMVTLSFERGTAFVSEVVACQRLLHRLAELAKKVTRRDATAWDDVALRRELGHLTAEFEALWALTKWNVSEASRSGVPGIGGSVFKLRFSETKQKVYELAHRLLDRAALVVEDVAGLPSGDLMDERLSSLSYTIAAGTSQIQRNIVGERILGLPKER